MPIECLTLLQMATTLNLRVDLITPLSLTQKATGLTDKTKIIDFFVASPPRDSRKSNIMPRAKTPEILPKSQVRPSPQRISTQVFKSLPSRENSPLRVGGGNSLKTVSDAHKIPVGGRLLRFKAAWKGAHHENSIKGGVSWSWEKTLPPPTIVEQHTTPDMDRMLAKLKRLRVIEKAKKLAWQSRLFTVPKKDSPEGRLILDLSLLNAYIKCPHFKMLTIREVKLLLPKGYWTVSLDLKDGFWHLPIARSKRPFLGFRWRKQNWQFRAMPFGLKVAL